MIIIPSSSTESVINYGDFIWDTWQTRLGWGNDEELSWDSGSSHKSAWSWILSCQWWLYKSVSTYSMTSLRSRHCVTMVIQSINQTMMFLIFIHRKIIIDAASQPIYVKVPLSICFVDPHFLRMYSYLLFELVFDDIHYVHLLIKFKLEIFSIFVLYILYKKLLFKTFYVSTR